MITYQRSGSSTGVSRSPMPSAQAEEPSNKNRDIRTEWQPELASSDREAAAPQLIQRQEHRGGVRAAPAQARAERDALAIRMLAPRRAPVAGLQRCAARTARSASGATPAGPAGRSIRAVLAHADAIRCRTGR